MDNIFLLEIKLHACIRGILIFMQNMAYLWGSFFTMGMDVLQFKRGIIHAPSGDTVMKFGLPKDDWRCFMYRLWKSSQDTNMDSDLKGNKLTQYVYLEQMDGVVMCKVGILYIYLVIVLKICMF